MQTVFVIDLGTATVEEGLAVLRALNDYHIAAGGLGLEFEVVGDGVQSRPSRKVVCMKSRGFATDSDIQNATRCHLHRRPDEEHRR